MLPTESRFGPGYRHPRPITNFARPRMWLGVCPRFTNGSAENAMDTTVDREDAAEIENTGATVLRNKLFSTAEQDGGPPQIISACR